MTKDNDLFDIKCVKFDADEAQSLIGKDVFVSDSLINLRDAVNRMDINNPCYYGKLITAQQNTGQAPQAQFEIDYYNSTFQYAYYDPYYELKCALKCGKTIEYKDGSDWDVITSPVFSDDPEKYRIKPYKPALKWQDLKIGDIVRGSFYKCGKKCDDFYGMVTVIDTDEYSDSHICVGATWIANANICKFKRVNAAGENIEW